MAMKFWHGLVGADIVQRELAIDDEEILRAIRVHTTGVAKMSLLDKNYLCRRLH